MRRIDIMRRAGRNLSQAKIRTLLTSLAIAVGAFTLTLSLAAGEGARMYADNLLKNNIDPKALFIVKDESFTSAGGRTGIQEYSEDTGSGSRPGATIKMMTNDDVKQLRERKDLAQVTPIYSLTPKYVSFEGNAKKYSAPVTYYDATTVMPVEVGSLPALGVQIGDGDIVLPQDFANDLGKSPQDLLGKKVTVTMVRGAAESVTQQQINDALMSGGEAAVNALLKPATKDYTFTVRAVTKKSAMAIASNPRLHVSTTQAQLMNDFATLGTSTAGKYVGVTAVANNADPADVKQELQEKYKYTVQTAKDAQNLLFTFVNILQGIVGGFGLLALLASVFGIINTQYISVLERTSQIGLMKALGMRSRDIGKLFRYEAAWIGFIGGVLGAGSATVLGLALNPFITKSLALGDGNALLVFVWWQIVALLIVLVLIAIVAGWFPSRKAAKLDPIEALRTE